MADIYVSTTGSDSNSGAQGSPIKTILKASQVAQAGTTVHVAPGSYIGGFQTTKSGTADAPIHYVSDVKWGAKIIPGAGNSKIEAWDNRGDNVIIDGFEIDGSKPQGGTPWLSGIYTTGTNSVVQNNKVHDIVRDTVAMKAAHRGNVGGGGILGDGYFGDTDISVTGNVVYNIGPSSRPNGLVHGIYMSTSGQVQNNMVYQASGDAITTWHDANHVKIVNNTIFASHNGVMIGGGDYYHTSGPNDYSQVSNNIIYDNDTGIMEFGDTGTNNIYSNNLIYGNGTNLSMNNGKVTGTVSADPKFVKYDPSGSGDYRLASDSSAVNSGTSSGAPTLDMNGGGRQGAVDIGAMEYRSTASTAPAATVPPASSVPSTPASTAATAKIVLNVDGTPAGGINAHFNLLIDGKKIGEGVAGTVAKDFVFTTSVAAEQAHKVQVQYDNDGFVNGQDRNLSVNKIMINGKAVAPTASNVTYDKGALDGKDVGHGQVDMWWNGTLVVNANKSLFPAATAKAAALPDGTDQLDVHHYIASQAPITADSSIDTNGTALIDHWASPADLFATTAHLPDPLHQFDAA
jgi:hypothetical protein